MSRPGSRLALSGITVEYPAVTALHDVSFTLEPGDAVALVGLSGAGKSTLLNVCNGMIRPTSGTVTMDGVDLTGAPPRALRQLRSRTGFIHQSLNLVPNIRVIQNVVGGRLGRRSLAGALRDFLFPSRHVVRSVYEILDSVGIADKLYERTDRLSGGQQQRVAIARALMQSPRILLADEPVSSVDPSTASATIDLLLRLSQRLGLTLCVSLHNLELARSKFSRLLALRGGRLVLDKPTETVSDAEFDALYALAQDGDSTPEPTDSWQGSTRATGGLVRRFD